MKTKSSISQNSNYKFEENNLSITITSILEIKKASSFVLLFIVAVGCMNAQTIYRNNYFTLNNTYPYKYLDSLNIDSAKIFGNNVTWNFQSNKVLVNSIATAIDPATTVFYNSQTNYYLSDLCVKYPLGSFFYIDSMYNYFITDNSKVSFIGKWANHGSYEQWNFHLTDSETYFVFPFSANDSVYDTFYGSYNDMSGSGFHYTGGWRSIVAEGNGTLILNQDTFVNCLKIKSIRHSKDTILMPFEGELVSYTWFNPNVNGPILEITGLDTSLSGYNVGIYYYANPSIIGTEELSVFPYLNIYPNPILDYCEINVGAAHIIDADKPLQLEIFTMDGQKIKEQRVSNNNTLVNFKNVQSGIYLLIIKEENRSIFFQKVIRL
ncbi:MAG: T9SS type A sorting domain-containing protein [Bacteroidetes bacterium]|nr:T9SS type A sorting domain-containing protein [Bacteroidota bacterium]